MTQKAVEIEDSWYDLLKDDFELPYFQEIIVFLKKQKATGVKFYPSGKKIFNAFAHTPFKKVKVVIIGQDPYHNPGEAMGLCFSVPKEVRIPPSLRNIYKEINIDLGVDIPNHGDLTQWADQGVLLLNTVLTVEHRKPGSHSKIGWQTFTDTVISKVSNLRSGVVFLLWGNYAKGKASLIDESKHLILQSAHPSPLAGKAFFNNHHFSKTNAYLSHNGQTPINWQID